MKTVEGTVSESGCRVGIVVSRWNSFITERLLEGALETLKEQGVPDDRITVAWCPGAYEIPLTAKRLLSVTDGVVALGAVIRGETSHYDYVCSAVNDGVIRLNLEQDKPVSFGVLTTENADQARDRSGQSGNRGNKGSEAALTLLEMFSLLKKIDHI